jgi:hypothetical protein
MNNNTVIEKVILTKIAFFMRGNKTIVNTLLNRKRMLFINIVEIYLFKVVCFITVIVNIIVCLYYNVLMNRKV